MSKFKLGMIYFGIWFVAYIAIITTRTMRPGLPWWATLIAYVAPGILGGITGYLIFKATTAEYYKKIVDKIYETKE